MTTFYTPNNRDVGISADLSKLAILYINCIYRPKTHDPCALQFHQILKKISSYRVTLSWSEQRIGQIANNNIENTIYVAWFWTDNKLSRLFTWYDNIQYCKQSIYDLISSFSLESSLIRRSVFVLIMA